MHMERFLTGDLVPVLWISPHPSHFLFICTTEHKHPDLLRRPLTAPMHSLTLLLILDCLSSYFPSLLPSFPPSLHPSTSISFSLDTYRGARTPGLNITTVSLDRTNAFSYSASDS
ncbi:hypothetical protein K435DRAFT_189787 [Dendrothele bispora CBS 962.96]|uniref:Uncharacterized protein n=1 Tax=Dendrothele bispora (strain CBS 962.96) TaxID=1314807 RepID=A0A4S8LVE8_DENBC|nr:hypothetical protein K435DRAFT_189787 [Dendrothele bispora CBS 962.96]